MQIVKMIDLRLSHRQRRGSTIFGGRLPVEQLRISAIIVIIVVGLIGSSVAGLVAKGRFQVQTKLGGPTPKPKEMQIPF